jgi:transcriptional regulator with XRE-family HTH domain
MNKERFYAELGRRLRQARTTARLTQAELADRAGVTRAALANIERGEQRMAAHQLVAVAAALGIEPAVLLPKADSLADRVEHAMQEAGLPREVAVWGAKAAERLAHRGDDNDVTD